MKKQEFIEELRCTLEGKLSEQDIREVLSDYGDVFDNGVAEGKTEDEISGELGSPAKIAHTILEEDEVRREEERRAASAFGKNSKYEPFAGRLAPMGTRLGASLLDDVFVGAVVVLLIFFFVGLAGVISGTGHGKIGEPTNWEVFFMALPILMVLGVLGAFNLVSTIFIWATNGYTPAKWLLHIRVVKLSGQKLSFMDALLRELIVKSVANTMLGGLLNVFSFLWGCLSKERKTVHDAVTETTVITVTRKQ